ncbi:N-acetylglucosamine kinase [Shewanella intestini]|uniref:ATPase n=1 Tax=Shewanella intestini TaxID=2017544 RepID=A0ABS5HYS7_9GAMM|nr:MULTISPECIES: BadF/BadG/BcrA/BcrD ATPase family protein [Shewanella]MBR9726708.1 ATPase [Shewanella intestini]MRG34726.1 ATPase [Shewanella sp. XMDDZSB0408]
MATNQNISMPLYLGVDGGGSKCRAIIYSQHQGVLGTGVAGRANPLHGIDHTLHSITVSTHLALDDAGLSRQLIGQLIAGVGLAGVNVPHLFNQINQWQHPFQAMYLTTDLHTACIGAHNGDDGAVIITGTGSCGYVHVGEQSLLVGGHGFGLGDKGSGAWLGQKAVEHVLLTLDGFSDASALQAAMLDHLETDNATGIVELLAGKSSSEYAKLARVVLACANQGDSVAIGIVKEGAEYISAMARKLFSLHPQRFSMIGGLAEPLMPWLDSDVSSKLAQSIAPPEIGAVYFAQQQHQQ